MLELEEGKALPSAEPAALYAGGTLIKKQHASGEPAAPARLDTAGCSAAGCMMPGCMTSPSGLNGPCCLMLMQGPAEPQHGPVLLNAGCCLDCSSVPEDLVHPPGSLHTPYTTCQTTLLLRVLKRAACGPGVGASFLGSFYPCSLSRAGPANLQRAARLTSLYTNSPWDKSTGLIPFL